MSNQLDAVISRWLAEAKKFRECANQEWDAVDDEESVLCLNEADRLEKCANEVRAALLPQETEL